MKALTVSQVNNYIRRLFNTDILLPDIYIEGEISNYKSHQSGNLYFTLKDSESTLKSVIFKNNISNAENLLEDGLTIRAKGYISIYPKNGEYQFYIEEIENITEGILHQKFLKLKEKLDKEGLFNNEYKKPIPKFPKKIGVVTSPTGAAIKDIISVLERRFPLVDVLIYPSKVQGKDSHKEVINGLLTLDNIEDIDLIIFGRGGGSLEDLSEFNNEELARVVFNLKKPNISAVGHEIDFTICDFVSDLRAPTPSVAAELSVPNIDEIQVKLNFLYDNLSIQIDRIFIKTIDRLNKTSNLLQKVNPLTKLSDKKTNLNNIYNGLEISILNFFRKEEKKIELAGKKLSQLNPSLKLKEGQAYLLDTLGSKIKSIEDVDINNKLNIILEDGSIEVLVLSKRRY